MKNRSSSLMLGLVAAVALPAQAMYVNPQGTGQVLLFPYYSVNSDQTTLITLVNTTNAPKMFQVKFREGYNSRDVLDFHLFLGPNDTWTASVFALQQGDGANVLTRDESCTAPDKPAWSGTIAGGYWQRFLPFAYTGAQQDAGPASITRTREGHVQIVELAELDGALAAAVTGVHPPDCAALQVVNPGRPEYFRPPGGGVYGSFAIVDVAEGTLYGGSATAVDDFSQAPLLNHTGSIIEWLSSGNSRPGEVDASVPYDGGYTTLTYSNTGTPRTGATNAISAVLMADSVFGTMSREAGVGSHTEWVLSSPTKFLHTDNLLLGAPLGEPGALPPYVHTFGGDGTVGSCMYYTASGFDLEGRPIRFAQDPQPPDDVIGALPQHALCYATNVVHFSALDADGSTPLLGSRLGSKVWNPVPATETASVRLVLGAQPGSTARSSLPAGLRGPSLRGLPVIGFEATRYVNGNISPGVLANYTMATPLRADVACVDAAGAAIDCP